MILTFSVSNRRIVLFLPQILPFPPLSAFTLPTFSYFLATDRIFLSQSSSSFRGTLSTILGSKFRPIVEFEHLMRFYSGDICAFFGFGARSVRKPVSKFRPRLSSDSL